MEDNNQNMQRRSALAMLADMRAGEFVADLTEKLADLTTDVIAHQAAGKLTITLSLKPGPAENALIVADDIKVAAPRARKQPTLLFSDEEGSLTRQDPKQHELDLSANSKVTRITAKGVN